MIMIRSSILAALLFVALGAVPAQAGGGIKIGVLTCKQAPGGINLLIHSVRVLACEFSTPQGKERYSGEAGIALGIDFEWDSKKTIIYTVFGGVSELAMGNHVLAGKYFGGKASVALGVGAGVQALIGGGSKNFTLQPLVLEGSEGVGVAAGASYLYLTPAK